MTEIMIFDRDIQEMSENRILRDLMQTALNLHKGGERGMELTYELTEQGEYVKRAHDTRTYRQTRWYAPGNREIVCSTLNDGTIILSIRERS